MDDKKRQNYLEKQGLYGSLSDLDLQYNEAFWSLAQSGPSRVCGRFTPLKPSEFQLNYGQDSFLFRGAYPQDLRAGDILQVHADLQIQEGEAFFEQADFRVLVPNYNPQFQKRVSISHANLKNWNRFLQVIRNFFYEQGFIEARTPTLVPSPGMEAFLEPFSTSLRQGKSEKKLYLPTSPEFHLKQLLVEGENKIFELKECFRNNEKGPHHQVEFLLLEWYRAYSHLGSIEKDVKDLLACLTKEFCDQEVLVETKTISQVFQDYLQFSLTPQTSREDLLGLLEKIGGRAHKLLNTCGRVRF